MKRLGNVLFSIVLLVMGVNLVNAEVYSDEFKKLISDGTWNVEVLNKPNNCNEVSSILEPIANASIDMAKYATEVSCLLDDVNELQVKVYSLDYLDNNYLEIYNIKVNYNVISRSSDERVNKILDEIIKETSSLEVLTLSDLNLISYLNDSNNVSFKYPGAVSNAISYTKNMQNILQGYNIRFSMNAINGSTGDDFGLYQYALGNSLIYYNNKLEDSFDLFLLQANYLYVDETESNLAAYAQKRINNYLGNSNVTVKVGGTLESLSYISEDESILECDEYGCIVKDIEYNWNDNEIFDLEKLADTEHYYIVNINGNDYRFVLYKGGNDELEEKNEYKSVDIISNIKVSSLDNKVPKDAILSVSEEKNKLLENILGTNQYIAYDLKLYSNLLGQYISTGKFNVEIPVPSYLEGKELVAYYISDEGSKEEVKLNVSNGIATLEVEHFSIYVISLKVDKVNDLGNPNTLDEIVTMSIVLLIAVIFLIRGLLYFKKNII